MQKYIEVAGAYFDKHPVMFTVLFCLCILIAIMFYEASKQQEEFEYPEDE